MDFQSWDFMSASNMEVQYLHKNILFDYIFVWVESRYL